MSKKLQYINYSFAGLFTLEALFKIIAYGPSYFRDNWNKFDFLVVSLTLIGVILDLSTSIQFGGKITLMRACRCIRVFRLINRARVLKIIVDTFIISLPALGNIGGLLLLIIYVYSIFGVQMFSGIRLNGDLT